MSHSTDVNLTWDAEARKWSGTPTVPTGGVYNASVTTGEDSAVFALPMKLDRVYRKLPAEDVATQETPPL